VQSHDEVAGWTRTRAVLTLRSFACWYREPSWRSKLKRGRTRSESLHINGGTTLARSGEPL